MYSQTTVLADRNEFHWHECTKFINTFVMNDWCDLSKYKVHEGVGVGVPPYDEGQCLIQGRTQKAQKLHLMSVSLSVAFFAET